MLGLSVRIQREYLCMLLDKPARNSYNRQILKQTCLEHESRNLRVLHMRGSDSRAIRGYLRLRCIIQARLMLLSRNNSLYICLCTNIPFLSRFAMLNNLAEMLLVIEASC